MDYPTSSQYLANIVINKNQDTENIFGHESKDKLTTSGGFPLEMFSKYYGGNSDKQLSDGLIKIGGLSVPLGLILNYENKDNNINHIKYNHEKISSEDDVENHIENDETIVGGGSHERQEYSNNIKEINQIEMDELFNMVCKSHDKQQSKKNMKNKNRITEKK